MKQSAAIVALLALAVTACRTAGTDAPPGFADPAELLRPWVGRVLVFRHHGDQTSVSLRRGQRRPGNCDAIVRVRSVDFDRGTARLSLVALGMPVVKGRRPQCGDPVSGMQLALEGFGGAPEAAAVAARLGEVLQTPEAYLSARRVPFDLAPGGAPEEAASPGSDGPTAEVLLGRKVTSWPEALLESEVWYRDPGGRVRHLGQVEVAAVVGTDGRLHSVEVRTGLADAQRQAVLSGMELWRFSPASTDEGPVAARVELTPTLRIF